MYLETEIHNKEIQINLEDLEIEVSTNAEGAIERITVDGQEPSNVEAIVIQDNMREIQDEVNWKLYVARNGVLNA